MSTIDTCRLCLRDVELRASHIFPKFIFDWMKRDAGPFLRRIDTPNRRQQDGIKQYLLCEDCEQRLNPAETWFAREIFRPFMDSFELEFDYGPELFRFLVSMHWRVLLHFMDQYEASVPRFRDKLRDAEEQWRKFLLNGTQISDHREIHLLFLDVNTRAEQPVRNLNRYLVNAVDGVVVRRNSRCAVYSKFLRFLSYAWITPIDKSLWVNTSVDPSGGHLTAVQEVSDADAGAAIFDRARRSGESFSNQISERQQGTINQWFLDNAERFLRSDLARAVEADFSATIDPMLGRGKKIGRNELCLCGSGRKYKRCCGRLAQ